VYHNGECSMSSTMVCFCVLAKVQWSTPSTSLLRVDNKSVIALIKNTVLHRQSKHIEVKYHLVRESIENGIIKVEYWSSSGVKSN
jgi:hypothetical protein